MATLNTVRYRNGSSWISILNLVYPIGSVYVAWVATSPATLFGGTWSQITGDRFFRFSTNVNTSAASNPAHSHNARGNMCVAWSPMKGGNATCYWDTWDNRPVWSAKWKGTMGNFGATNTTFSDAVPVLGTTASATPAIVPAAQNMYAWHRTA